MSAPFEIQCAICTFSADNWQHQPCELGAKCPRPEDHHDYEPDERSVEWAALKLREALDTVAVRYPYCTICGAAASIKEHAPNCRFGNALALADAAGIKATATANKQGAGE